ncbi:hypoxanthine phosphoribosyltransferase [Bacteroidota bacterium]
MNGLINENINVEIVIANGKKFKKFIDRKRIEAEVDRISELINNDYHGKKVLFIVVLKGSIFFASDLLRKIKLDCEIETVRASSYGNEMKNSELRLCIDNIEAEGKNILIIEDIIETGNTLNELMSKLRTESPGTLEAITFLSKPEKREFNIFVKYVGIEIPPEFVIGYGLDYAEQGRHLPDIYVLDEE